uniref:RabBD domain-containing protein n=1 Tax=Monopterus albus TaxID=43700 RepID=A0A3Q3QP27_MONAL
MINLSHLTEEEQEKIMVVLRRDAELKKAEEDRIRKLEKILDGGSHPEPKLKCLSGEWFYEVKSRRHTDKIHGSEIILASMKHWKAADGSPTAERVKTPSTQGSNVATPPKPARSWEALKPQEIKDGDGLSQSSARRSQRMSRHNPFDRSSIIVYEPPENNDVPTIKDQRFGPEEQECKSPLKTAPAGDGSQNSGGSITSEGSSVGLRPVPKKRKFLSNYSSHQAESSGLSLDTREGSEELPPAPRQSLQQGPLESPNLSLLKSPDDRPQPEMPEIGALQLSSQPSSSADKAFQEPLFDVFQKSSPERERTPPTTRDRLTTYTRGDGSTEREERDDQAQRESNTFILPTSNIQDSNKETNSSVATAAKQEDLSITQSTVGMFRNKT